MHITLGDYEMVTYIHMKRVDGSNDYYRVTDDEMVELTRDEFLAYGGVEN